ncbi:MAG: choice-of-anchor Q domain-containing protein [Chitinophagales bacterium]|nr:choice-of-anchor Q domain-containing protein [Chitinophagales bacterium]
MKRLSSILLSIFASLHLWAQNMYYVSTAGNDANDGKTLSTAWRTIQKAANTAGAGSTIYIRGGTYNERISVNKSGNATKGYITYMPYQGEYVIVDATGKTGNSDNVFYLYNRSYIRITGLEIRNNTVPANKDGAGIFIEGKGSYLEIRKCTIHHMLGTNAMAITVYGTNKKSAIQNLVIDSNWVYNCEPAPSEAITLNGNVRLFQVTNNIVHDVNNIGIDFIGGEGICPNAANDNARNGLCANNIVYRARSNYGGGYAAGIYIDGGDSIIVERNRIFECDLGLEVGCENANNVAAYNIIRNNIIYNNDKRGLSFGGYNYPHTGKVEYCQFLNNTLYHNDVLNTGEGELFIEYANHCTVKQNIIVGNGVSYLMNFYVTGTTGNQFNYNCYYTTSGSPKFIHNNIYYSSFSAYQNGSGQDAQGMFAHPALANPSAFDFHLLAASPCIDAGDPSFVPSAGEKDFYGNNRVIGSRVDIGASEFGGSYRVAALGFSLTLYPSVAQDFLRVTVHIAEPQSVMVFVTDVNGRKFHQEKRELFSGVNEWSVSLAPWPKGRYFFTVETAHRKVTRPFIIP